MAIQDSLMIQVPRTPSKIATVARDEFRRRDLNVVPVLERTGLGAFEEKAMALSGVFTLATGVWTAPVLIGPSGSVVMDDPAATTTLLQGFQVYHCAKASLFHRVTNESHTLLFGGLTVPEIGLALGASESTIKRRWTFAKAWLSRELKDGKKETDSS